MTLQAFVGVDVDLIAIDRMWDQWRLFRIIAGLPQIIVHHLANRWWAGLSVQRGAAAQGGDMLLRNRCGDQQAGEQGGDEDTFHDQTPIGSILTAHFLKSVCFDSGSVASSVTLLIS